MTPEEQSALLARLDERSKTQTEVLKDIKKRISVLPSEETMKLEIREALALHERDVPHAAQNGAQAKLLGRVVLGLVAALGTLTAAIAALT
jgi:hypothetical protein